MAGDAERRRHIAEALWRVVVARGMEGASMRHVAAEAGVSVGMLQHHFRDKDQMVMFALDSMTEQVGRRMGERMAGLVEPRELVRAVLLEMLPLDEERRLEAHVSCAFLGRAAVDDRLATYLRDGHIQAHAFLAEQIGRVDPEGAHQEANVLLALVTGFTFTVLAGQ